MYNNLGNGYMFKPVREIPLKDDDLLPPVDGAANSPEVKSSFTNRCRCDECEVMPTVVENVCCMNNSVINSKLPTLDSSGTCSCITKDEAFPIVCLRKDILEIQLCTIRDLIAEKMQHPVSSR